jgi:hypothetical protein
MLNPLKKQTEEEKSKGDEFNATGRNPTVPSMFETPCEERS